MERIAQLASDRYPSRRLTLAEQHYVCDMVGLMSPTEHTYIRDFIEWQTKQTMVLSFTPLGTLSNELQVMLWVIVVLHNKIAY